MSEQRRVLLANGQYITIVQTTGTSSGDVMSQSAVTAALNAKANKVHTHAASDITSGTFGTDRIANGAITKVKLGSDISLPSTSYETVTVSGLTSDRNAAVGAEATIGGVSYKFDNTGVVSAQIPYGQVYKVQAHANSTWVGSYETTFTANTSSRSITITYSGSSGVFIEATNGMLYTSSEWSSSKTANSIVVAGNGVSFRMAVTQAPSAMPISSSYTDPLENYMTGISDATAAKADYNGSGNTANIIKMQPSTDYAAGYCNAFTFPDGKTKGFLPSLGQLNLAYQNKAAVDAALSKCGGTAMTNDYYWSSTFWGVDGNYRICWRLNWSDGYVNYNGLNSNYYVRPFAAY